MGTVITIIIAIVILVIFILANVGVIGFFGGVSDEESQKGCCFVLIALVIVLFLLYGLRECVS